MTGSGPLSVWVWIAVCALGGTFSVGRFLLDGAISSRTQGGFPLGTFAVNISGSFALGWLVGATLSGTTLLLAGSASVGAYTTFSTWMFEAHRLGEDADRRPLVAYLLGSVVVGLLAAGAGHYLGRTL
jgi:fluoride exporter